LMRYLFISIKKTIKMKNEKKMNSHLLGISYLTGLNLNFLTYFIIQHKLNIEAIYNKVVKMNISEKKTFICGIVGNEGNKIQKNIIKTFKN